MSTFLRVDQPSCCILPVKTRVVIRVFNHGPRQYFVKKAVGSKKDNLLPGRYYLSLAAYLLEELDRADVFG
jgi:hypothetical protein